MAEPLETHTGYKPAYRETTMRLLNTFSLEGLTRTETITNPKRTNGGAFRAVAFLAFSGILVSGVKSPNELQGCRHYKRLGVRRDKARSGANNPTLPCVFPCRHIVRAFSSKFFSCPLGLHKNAAWVKSPGCNYKEAAMSSQLNSRKLQRNPAPTVVLDEEPETHKPCPRQLPHMCDFCDQPYWRLLNEYVRDHANGRPYFEATDTEIYGRRFDSQLRRQLTRAAQQGLTFVGDYQLYLRAMDIDACDYVASPVTFLFIHRNAL